MKKSKLLILSLLTLFALASCGSKDENGDSDVSDSITNIAVSISFENKSVSITEDTSYPLQINSSDENAKIKWTSSDNSIASVDDNGVVLAKMPGKALITAICGESTDTCEVIVLKDNYKKTYLIESDLIEYNLEESGNTIPLDFKLYTLSQDGVKEEVKNAIINYELSNDNYATINEKNEIVPKKNGKVTLNVKYEDVCISKQITVYKKFISNPTEWQEMFLDNKVGDMFKLDSNIDFSSVEYQGPSFDNPLTNMNLAFNGILDGNGYEVNNITLNGSSSKYVSVFGNIYNGKIKNLSLNNIVVKGSNIKASALAASISGSSSMIENVYIDVNYSVKPSEAYIFASSASNVVMNNVLANVESVNNNTKSDRIKSFKSVSNSALTNVFVLAQNNIVGCTDVNAYFSKMDLVWYLNKNKSLDPNKWTYLSDVELPIISKGKD